MGTKASSVFSSLPFLRVAAFSDVVGAVTSTLEVEGAEEGACCGINDECLRL